MTRHILALAAAAMMMASCEKEIPGHPEKVMEAYLRATQAGDFEQIFRLNFATAKEDRFNEPSSPGASQRRARRIEAYHDAEQTFTPGIVWAERHFFPPKAACKILKAHPLAAVGDDPVNADYERALSIIVPVEVTYAPGDPAPVVNGKPLRFARYDCTLRKIREPGAVSVYSDDDVWRFSGCVADMASFKVD